MAFELPDLPYAHDALASKGMSKETLEYHHDIHHNTYVTTLNKLIDGTEWADKSLEEIVKGTYEAGAVAQSGLFNNASQHWNHTQFWEMMGPGTNDMPSELESRLTDAFGSVDKFKEDFAAAGGGQFGSGWAWLVLKDGKLHIQAGGGVVLDSDPQYEYDETQHKAGALKRAAELAAAYEFDQ